MVAIKITLDVNCGERKPNSRISALYAEQDKYS